MTAFNTCYLARVFKINTFYSCSNILKSDFFRDRIRFTKNILERCISTYNSPLLCSQNESKKKSNRTFLKGDGTEVRRKEATTPRITLFDINGNKTAMYLEQAEKLAKRNGLQLVKVKEVGDTLVYKLLKVSAPLDENVTNENRKTKRIIIQSDIFIHDLHNKIHQMSKLLEKGCDIFLQLKNLQNDVTKINEILKEVESQIGSKCAINQKVETKSGINIVISSQKSTDTKKKILESSETNGSAKAKI